MARRDPSAASRSSSSSRRGSAAGRSSGRAGGRGRDGKVDIYCPQCGEHFRIAETAVDSKVTCTQCTRTFFAKTVVGKRARSQDNTRVYVAFGVGAVVVVGTLMLLSKFGERPVQPVIAGATGPSQLDIDRQTRRDQAMRWARAVAKDDLFTLDTYSDLGALRQQLGVDATLTGNARDEALLAALKKDDGTRLFYEMECTAADLTREDVAAGGGTVDFYLSSKPGDSVYDPKAGARLQAQWHMVGAQMKITGFTLTLPPIVRGRRPGDESKFFKPSAEIERPKQVEIDRNGKATKVQESPAVPIAHLQDTPPALQAEIDDLVADLLRSADPESPGNLFMRTTVKLRQIGKPAMPRLVNALNDLYPDVNGNNLKISQVTRALLDLTGMALAYDVRGTGDAQKDKAARESVIRQWFAWWWRYANDDYQEAIDQSEDLLDGPTKTGDKDK